LDEEEARELFDDGDASKRRKRATTGRDTWMILSWSWILGLNVVKGSIHMRLYEAVSFASDVL
jgi:hypothetical protein